MSWLEKERVIIADTPHSVSRSRTDLPRSCPGKRAHGQKLAGISHFPRCAIGQIVDNRHKQSDARRAVSGSSAMADRPWMASCLWLSLIVTCGSLQQILASKSEPEIVSGKPARKVCYYQAATVNRPGGFGYKIEDIPGDLCSHIIYAFADISNITWEVKYSNKTFDVDESGYKRFVDLKNKHPGLTASISIGGDGKEVTNVFSQMASVKERRDKFVESVKNLVKKYKFDGVDVDWEYPNATDEKENFLLLMKELRAKLDKENQGLELTMAVPIVRCRLVNGYNVPELCRIVDAVHLMGYDLRGVWNNQTDVHSMLYRRPELDSGIYEEINLNNGSLLWEEFGCPRDKLVLGVPFYGRSFTLYDPSQHGLHAPITGPGKPSPILEDPEVLTYFEVGSFYSLIIRETVE